MGTELHYMELLKGCVEYGERPQAAGWDCAYEGAERKISEYWGNPGKMAEGVGVLLRSWNPHVRPARQRLEECISKWLPKLKEFRERDIDTFSSDDHREVEEIFNDFLAGSAIEGRGKTPVGVAKTLHILAPRLFPIWDNGEAKAYGCHWGNKPDNALGCYLKFIEKIKERYGSVIKSYQQENPSSNKQDAIIAICGQLYQECHRPGPKPLLKLIDEYNWSKTHWSAVMLYKECW